MSKEPIGVFDSGLGGLTAVKELLSDLPSEDIKPGVKPKKKTEEK